MKRTLAALALMGLVASCTDDAAARRATGAMGLTDIEPTGYRWFGCSEDDLFHTGFKAKNASGETVTGVVCSGWLKGATVRFD